MQNEKAVMLKEIALQPDFVRDNIDPMLGLHARGASPRASPARCAMAS